MDNEQLAKYRTQIDAIDEQIFNLLKLRSYIIPKVINIKKSSDYKIAFAREFEMAKKIANTDFGLYSPIFIQKMYRNLISATLKIENSLNIGLLDKSDPSAQDTWELAVDHFSTPDITYTKTPEELFKLLLDKKLDCAIISAKNCKSKWWILLGQPAYQKIKINLQLPFLSDNFNTSKAYCLSLNHKDTYLPLSFYIVQGSLHKHKDITVCDSYDKYTLITTSLKESNLIKLGIINPVFIGSTYPNLKNSSEKY